MRQLVRNAGLEGSVVVEQLSHEKRTNWGFDVMSEEYIDLVQAGIIDPAKVTRTALENAASVAAMILTTEALVTDRPEKKSRAADARWRRRHVRLGVSRPSPPAPLSLSQGEGGFRFASWRETLARWRAAKSHELGVADLAHQFDRLGEVGGDVLRARGRPSQTWSARRPGDTPAAGPGAGTSRRLVFSTRRVDFDAHASFRQPRREARVRLAPDPAPGGGRTS